ncbi:MAG TPA: MBL fold metallo-hydrolase [Anaerolineae bacterium]|nr:MBL fold metallo-hydrolase [Anaerolineae bacterium]
MAAKQIAPGVHAIPLGGVNAFLLETEDGLVLIDTGLPNSTAKILKAVQALGNQPGDIRHILITHCHWDHTGSLAELKQETGAPAYMHPTDAALLRAGETMRPFQAGPGLVNGIIYRLFQLFLKSTPIAPLPIEYEVQDGEGLPWAGGLRAIHAPGHTAGQLAFLWPHYGGVLFAADTANTVLGLRWHFVYEDLAEAKRSLVRLGNLDFEVACFGHGGAIVGGAAQRFRQKWAI